MHAGIQIYYHFIIEKKKKKIVQILSKFTSRIVYPPLLPILPSTKKNYCIKGKKRNRKNRNAALAQLNKPNEKKKLMNTEIRGSSFFGYASTHAHPKPMKGQYYFAKLLHNSTFLDVWHRLKKIFSFLSFISFHLTLDSLHRLSTHKIKMDLNGINIYHDLKYESFDSN